MKGHLITCLSSNDLEDFDSNGYVGLGPFYPRSDSTRRQVGARLRILWDVIADLKRVQPGDICFLHTEGYIYGPYVFRSGFLESRALPNILRSPNTTLDNWWDHRNEFDGLYTEGYGYVASIDKPRGCNTSAL